VNLQLENLLWPATISHIGLISVCPLHGKDDTVHGLQLNSGGKVKLAHLNC